MEDLLLSNQFRNEQDWVELEKGLCWRENINVSKIEKLKGRDGLFMSKHTRKVSSSLVNKNVDRKSASSNTVKNNERKSWNSHRPSYNELENEYASGHSHMECKDHETRLITLTQIKKNSDENRKKYSTIQSLIGHPICCGYLLQVRQLSFEK